MAMDRAAQRGNANGSLQKTSPKKMAKRMNTAWAFTYRESGSIGGYLMAAAVWVLRRCCSRFQTTLHRCLSGKL